MTNRDTHDIVNFIRGKTMQNELKTISGLSQLLQTLEGGQLHADASEELHNMLVEMATYANTVGGGRAKSEMTITLSFEQELDTVKIRPKIKTKGQEIPRRATNLFMTPGNRLSMEHPMQNALPFGSVIQGGAPRKHETAAVVHSGQDHYDPETGEVHN